MASCPAYGNELPGQLPFCPFFWCSEPPREQDRIEEHTVSEIDRRREHLIETYRKKAKHYDITSRLYPAPGYPQRAQRLRAVQALGLR